MGVVPEAKRAPAVTMKILAPGVPRDDTWVGVCDRCGCVFECGIIDIEFATQYDETRVAQRNCPEPRCRRMLILTKIQRVNP